MEPQAIIPWKKRGDLIVSFMNERGDVSYVVKDPLSLQYFTMSPVEFEFLQRLDGTVSLHEILQRLKEKYPERNDSVDSMKVFLSTLIGANLLTCTVPGHGRMRANQASRRARHASRWLSRLNLVSMRFRGVDPHRFLKWLDAYLGWIYSTPVLVATCLLIVFAVAVFIGRVFGGGGTAQLFQSLLTAQNLPLLLISIVLVKVIHELGHGLTCVHYGGECHELGVLFVAFCPLPYCDTTDSWLHESRWNRALVASAGIFVEAIIASVCCLLWSISVPGVLSLLLLNLMVICSVNTLLVNGNPLLRYDGYYVVSDVFNYPNLGPEARRLAISWFNRLVFGERLTSDVRVTPQRIPVVLYGMASGLYRLFVMLMILWAIHQLLKRSELESLTPLIAFPMIASMLLSVIAGGVRKGRAITGIRDVPQRIRALTGMVLFVIMIGGICFFPFPYTVVAPFSVEPGKCLPVYVSVPGRLTKAIEAESQVEKGSVVARLENPAVSLELQRIEGEVASRELHLKNLQRFRSVSPIANSWIPAAQDTLVVAKDRYQAERQRHLRLTVTSPREGTLYPPRNRSLQTASATGVRFWSGTPLDQQNESIWLEAQTLIGWVGGQEDFQADVYVSQSEMAFLKPDAVARLTFFSDSTNECTATIENIGSERVKTAPRELFRNNLVAEDRSLGQFHLGDVRYRVQLRIVDGQPGALYSTGLAKIECTPMSLASRVWRMVRHAFAADF